MAHPKLNRMEWDEKGVERMEFFVAQHIASSVTSEIAGFDHNLDMGELTDRLRCISGKDIDFLSMNPMEAGTVMAALMREELIGFLMPLHELNGFAYGAIDGIISDQLYDEDHPQDP